MSTASELAELNRRLYGGVPGQEGDIPLLRADVSEVKETLGSLTGFYRGVRNAAVVGASMMTILSGLMAIYAVFIK